MKSISKEVRELIEKRNELCRQKRFAESDAIRKKIEKLGYAVADTKTGAAIKAIEAEQKARESFLLLFGSGEIAPSAVKAHSRVLQGIGKDRPKIVILSTPAGFQPNVKVVCEEIADFFKQHLKNYHPRVQIVYANTGEQANNSALFRPLDEADYIFAGPGSPTYAVRSLRDSLLMTKIGESVRAGASLGLSSAAAIAFSRFALPVYEIYKAGFDLYWEYDLNFYKEVFQELTVVPHFNNNEGGEKHDTSRAWMGKERFKKLVRMLPKEENLWGIDEHTAVFINLQTQGVEIMGKGEFLKIAGA